jgi:trk system potassium uptake protein TrkH
MTRSPRLTPWTSIFAWILAAVCGAGGLVLAHGFKSPVVARPELMVRIGLTACLGLFALSRLFMLTPPSMLGSRLARWWVDYVLIVAATAWWIVNPDKESFILHVGALYVLLVGMSAIARAGIDALSENTSAATVRRMAIGLIGGAVLLAVLGGTLLSLPACETGPSAVDANHPLAWYQLKVKWLDNTYTAVAALTGTGAGFKDIGRDYNRVGQSLILLLMQIGGLSILAVGAVVGMRFRELLGWGGGDDDTSSSGLKRVVRWTCVLAILIEVLGAVAIYRMWDPAVDLNFATAQRQPELLGTFARDNLNLGDRYEEARVFAAVFHSVSAFCDAGLTLTTNGYLPYRNHPAPLLAIMPLMFLGSLGGPVLVEMLRRMTRRHGIGLEGTSKDVYVTLLGSLAIMLVGAGLLYGIESTRDCQQRYPREHTPGRLMVASQSASTQPASQAASNGVIEFSAATSQRARSERLNGMDTSDRATSALFQAEASRTGGVRSVRIDESSLSPASHLVMMALMLVGGGVGGTAGGLRVVTVCLLLGAIVSGGKPRPRGRAARTAGDPTRGIALVAAIAASMTLLIGVVALVLVYREAGSPLACVFEAVSVCCNVGLSVGLNSELSLVGKVTVVVGMLAGRLIPIIILLRAVLSEAPALSRPLVESPSTSRSAKSSAPVEDEDAPIPLE